jgi:hypothetical protein
MDGPAVLVNNVQTGRVIENSLVLIKRYCLYIFPIKQRINDVVVLSWRCSLVQITFFFPSYVLHIRYNRKG